MPTFAPDFGHQTIPESDVLGYFMSALGIKKRKEAKEKTIRIVGFNLLKKIIYYINLKKSILMETISDVIDKKLHKSLLCFMQLVDPERKHGFENGLIEAWNRLTLKDQR